MKWREGRTLSQLRPLYLESMTWTNLSDCLVQIAISEDNERGLPPELQRDPLGIAFSSTEETEEGGSAAVSKY